MPAQVLLGDRARLRLQRALCAVRHLAVDEPGDCDAGAQEHDARVQGKAKDEPRSRLVLRRACRSARVIRRRLHHVSQRTRSAGPGPKMRPGWKTGRISAWRRPRTAAARAAPRPGGASSTTRCPSGRASSSRRSRASRTSRSYTPDDGRRRLRPRPRLPGRLPVHARRLPVDVPRPALDDAAVRRLRHRRGDERALPLPARARADRASRPPSTCRR